MKRKTKRYAEGGGIDEDMNAGMAEAYNAREAEASPVEEPVTAKPASLKAEEPASFGSAFAAARKSGAKTFEYKGKKFTTDVAGSSTKPTPARESESAAETRRLANSKASAKAAPQRSVIKGTSAAEAVAMAKAAMERKRARDSAEDAKPRPSLKNFDPKTQSGMGTLKFAKGGKIDGCAMRGKTKGKVY